MKTAQHSMTPWSACLSMLIVLTGGASFAEAPAPPDSVRGGEGARSESAVWIEHHGSFRFRPELLLGGDLGHGESPVPEPLAAKTGQDPDASTLTWASVRLRYRPTLHLGPDLAVHLGIDALDNLILGQTHQNAGGDLAINLLDDAATSPSAGTNGTRDAVRVRELWGQWNAFGMLDVRLGRMARQFGLGINRNAGLCEDCDFGSVVDQVRAGFTLTGFRVEFGWEFTASGATTASPNRIGQPMDLGQDDDVSTYTIEIGQRPVSAIELAAREKLLNEDRGWAFDWSVFTSLTDQELSSLEQTAETSLECAPAGVLANGTPIQSYDCVRLYPRDAFFWKPGLWFKAEHRPDFMTSWRLELELQGVVGEIEHPQRLEDTDSKEAKDIVSFGGALEIEYRHATLGVGLDAGFATGDDADFIGVLDGQNIVDPDDDAFALNDNVRGNGVIESFWFNRDYRLDLILFRQILGTVTNAVYLKPWIEVDVLQMEDAVLSARLDALYAAAVRPSGTPGDGRHWGFEVDGRLTLKMDSGLSGTLAAGLLIPLDALNNRETGASPDPAFSLQGLVGISF